MTYKTYPDPRQEVKPDDSIYKPEVDWEPLGKPYHIMVLEMHERNQRVIMIHEADGDFINNPMLNWTAFNDGFGIVGYHWECDCGRVLKFAQPLDQCECGFVIPDKNPDDLIDTIWARRAAKKRRSRR